MDLFVQPSCAKRFIAMKKEHAAALEEWLNVIGEFEMLNSLANLSFNNPDFVFLTLNTEFKIDFKTQSSKLLNASTRVGNEVLNPVFYDFNGFKYVRKVRFT
jgi:hypothetical protein